MSTAFIKPFAYGALNILSASGIVFANKLVLSTFAFHFLSALAFIHTIVTVVGLQVFSYFGVFTAKHLPVRSTAPLAVAYVGYIVLNNLNLRLNTVGFYQISKIAVAPAVLGLEAVFFGKRQSSQVRAAHGMDADTRSLRGLHSEGGCMCAGGGVYSHCVLGNRSVYCV